MCSQFLGNDKIELVSMRCWYCHDVFSLYLFQLLHSKILVKANWIGLQNKQQSENLEINLSMWNVVSRETAAAGLQCDDVTTPNDVFSSTEKKNYRIYSSCQPNKTCTCISLNAQEICILYSSMYSLKRQKTQCSIAFIY